MSKPYMYESVEAAEEKMKKQKKKSKNKASFGWEGKVSEADLVCNSVNSVR